MKKIFFGPNYKKSGVPFWQPWGCLGYLFRLLGFLLLLILLVLLLGLFRQCDSGDRGGRTPVAEVSDPDWNRPIAGAEDVGLPSPEENPRR